MNVSTIYSMFAALHKEQSSILEQELAERSASTAESGDDDSSLWFE